MKAVESPEKQHESVRELLVELKKLDGAGRRRLMDSIGEELARHVAIEEETFYPAMSQQSAPSHSPRHA